MKAMLDTNILFSAALFPSAQTAALRRRLVESCEIVLCSYVLKELRLVTQRKFPSRMAAMEAFLDELSFTLVQTPDEGNNISPLEMRDPKDQPILAAAIKEDVDVFITGDKDFLVLDIDKPQILTMTEFLQRY